MHWTWRSAALACAATLACAGTAAAAPGYDDATVIVEFRPGTTAVRQQAVLGGAPVVGTINDLGAAGRDQQFGYGRVNLARPSRSGHGGFAARTGARRAFRAHCPACASSWPPARCGCSSRWA